MPINGQIKDVRRLHCDKFLNQSGSAVIFEQHYDVSKSKEYKLLN